MRVRGAELIPGEPGEDKALSKMIDAPLGDRSKWAAQWPVLEDPNFELGKAKTVRAGSQVTVVSYGRTLPMCVAAAEKLAGEGIDAEVIDLRTLRPLDTATVLKSLKKTNRVVVVEEGWPTCSIASEISAVCMEQGFDDLDAPVLRVTNEDVPMPYAANLEKLMLVSADKIVAAVKSVLYR
jgi:pyruvate dehydrogenase E1 component beta subunit